ncbi:conjugative transposon protein TraK [Niabella sp. CJ426]|uniref:conjugative transposon protein TraK n=1 Tax=Niabella sp. CJ426 TaxID=3393740 RepID=UPI003CFF63D1
MFRQFKNIETAFKHIKVFSLVLIIAVTGICLSTIYWAITGIDKMQQRVYIISNGKLLEAESANRKDNVKIELEDHIKTFHFFFFTLAPDEVQIKAQLSKALYLADGSAKAQYDNLRENGYYSNMVSGNVSQRIEPDSITISVDRKPYYFRYYARLYITRPTSTVTRSMVTEGYIRDGLPISSNNVHGFLIERWATLDNRDIDIKAR